MKPGNPFHKAKLVVVKPVAELEGVSGEGGDEELGGTSRGSGSRELDRASGGNGTNMGRKDSRWDCVINIAGRDHQCIAE